MNNQETCPHCGAGRFNTYDSTNCYETEQYACGTEYELYDITFAKRVAQGEIKLLVSPDCYERQLAAKDVEIENLRDVIEKMCEIASKKARSEVK